MEIIRLPENNYTVMIRKICFLLLVTSLAVIYPARVNAQTFLEEDKIAIADSIGTLMERFNQAIRIDEEKKRDQALYKENLLGLFRRPNSRIANFALPDSIIGFGEFLTIEDYAEKSITSLHSVETFPYVRFFGSFQQNLRGFTGDLVIESYRGGHVVTIPIELGGFESTVLNRGTNLPETQIEMMSLDLQVVVFFESSVRARRFMQTNPRDVYDFSIREIRIPDEEPEEEFIEPEEKLAFRFAEGERERMEGLIRGRIGDLVGWIQTNPPLMGLRHPINMDLNRADQYRLLDYFAYPDEPWIDESIFFADAIGVYMSPRDYVDRLLDEQISLEKILPQTDIEGEILYVPSEDCSNMMHIFYINTFEIAGDYETEFGRIPFDYELELYFQFDFEYQTRFMSDQVQFAGTPRIAGINKSMRLLECIPEPPKWNLSFGLNYLHDYHSFGMIDQHSLDGLKSTFEYSSAGGVDIRYNRFSDTGLEWAISTGFHYGIVQAGFQAKDVLIDRLEPNELFDEPDEYQLIISGKDLAQRTEYMSMMIPLRFHLLYNLSRNAFFDFSVGLQLSINDQPATKQASGSLNYKGEFKFFDDVNPYLIENIPEYGFDDYVASLTGPDISLTDFTIGGLASVKFVTRISAGMPLFFEFGPHVYIAFNEVFEANNDTRLIRSEGEMGNIFNYAGTGTNMAFGFSTGLRYFIR